MVKNEQDVIEPFVRHNIRLVDRLVVLDNGSVDDTHKILLALAEEFDNLVVVADHKFGYTQSEKMTALLHRYCPEFAAEYVVPLDADEFIDAPDRDSFVTDLGRIPRNGAGLIFWATFVLTPQIVDAIESSCDDPLRQMTWLRSRETGPLPFWKSILRIDPSSAESVIIEQGNHFAHFTSGEQLPTVRLDRLRLMHFPVRSRRQFIAKSVVGWMAYLAKNPQAAKDSQGIHWQTNCRQLTQEGDISTQALCDLSLTYAQLPRQLDWDNDVVQQPPGLIYERRYSTGRYLGALELVARSWEQSLKIPQPIAYERTSPASERECTPVGA